MRVSMMIPFDGFLKTFEQCRNDIIVAEQTNDIMLHTKALIKMTVLTTYLMNHSRSSIMMMNDLLTREQVQELTVYEQSLNMLRGM